MKLSELPDKKLNEMCCEILGWQQKERKLFEPIRNIKGEVISTHEFYWYDQNGRSLDGTASMGWFTFDLNLIQQHLIPYLKSKNTGDFEGPEDRYVKSLLKSTQGHGAGVMHDPLFQAMNAPARTRVLAFLEALGVEVSNG